MNKKKLLILVLFVSMIGLVSASLTDSLISYYKLDEQDVSGSGTIYDSLGINNATNVGASNSTGIIENAYDFESTETDRIRIDDGTGDFSQIGDQDFTLNVWVKPESLANYRTIFGATDDGGVIVFVNGSGKVCLACKGFPHVAGTDAIYSGEWSMVTMTFNASANTFLYYINGTADSGGAVSFTDTFSTGSGYDIGTFGTTSYPFDGIIDEFGMWTRILTSTEITDLYNSGDGLTYPFAPVDTCTCPGAGNNWEIDHSDACIINDDCDLTTGTLSFTGSGTTKINATITTTNLGDPGATGILEILSNALIWIKG